MLCKICGEPFDRYAVQHDFTPSERSLFKKGKGCPCCKGKVPEHGKPDIFEVIRSHVDNTEEDPLEALIDLLEVDK